MYLLFGCLGLWGFGRQVSGVWWLSRLNRVLVYRLLKRWFDIGAVLVCLPFIMLLLLPAMLLVRCLIAERIFLVQPLVGYQGRIFTIYKLTTMQRHANGHLSVNWLGRQLRKWHLDELPQVWNILKGDMTLIGPRPEMVEKARHYEGVITDYAQRYAVIPGMTGLSQVRLGHVINVSGNRQKVLYDLLYIRRQGWRMDGFILVATLKALFCAFGGGEAQVQQLSLRVD